MKRVVIILLASTLLLQISSVNIVSAQQRAIKTFAQWCQHKDSLHENTRHTIDILLLEASTKNCQEADRNLNKLNQLQIGANHITDLSPLASLTNLTSLDLGSNRKINDISPLSRLNNLINLDLSSTQIVDLRPLASLKKLTELDLESNKIDDISPLASLNNLNFLYLGSNNFTRKHCPLEKISVCVWENQRRTIRAR
jgi:internalin A